jgi:hypothetical protein
MRAETNLGGFVAIAASLRASIAFALNLARAGRTITDRHHYRSGSFRKYCCATASRGDTGIGVCASSASIRIAPNRLVHAVQRTHAGDFRNRPVKRHRAPPFGGRALDA